MVSLRYVVQTCLVLAAWMANVRGADLVCQNPIVRKEWYPPSTPSPHDPLIVC